MNYNENYNRKFGMSRKFSFGVGRGLWFETKDKKGSQSGAFYGADYCEWAISPEPKNPWIVIRDLGIGEAVDRKIRGS